MVIRDIQGFEDIDEMLSQSVTTTIVAPGAPGSGSQAIPVVSLGPVQVMSRSGATIPQVIATIRTPSKIVSTVAAPSGLFQATIDQADLDAGAVVIFSGSGYLSTTVQAIGLLCNRGTRNEFGQTVTMSSIQCSFPVYYLDPVQSTIPQTPYPPTYAPSAVTYGVPYGGPGYAQPMYPPPPSYGPPPYPYPPAPDQEVRYKSSDIPVEDRPRRPRRAPKPMKDETVPSPPSATPENQAVPRPPATAPGIFALTDSVNPWLLAGGGVLVIGAFIWLVKN